MSFFNVINILSLLPHYNITARTQEFLFNARLLGSINFNELFLGTTSTKTLLLQNQQDKDVQYTLITDGVHESMKIKVVDQNMLKTVPTNCQVTIKIIFTPMYEGVIESVLIIHTIDGDYPIHIHGNGIECIYYLTLNANNENETKKEQKQEHLQVSSQAKEQASRNGSTVVDIFIPLPSFKPRINRIISTASLLSSSAASSSFCNVFLSCTNC